MIYLPMAQIDESTEGLLNQPIPTWLDHTYPHIPPPTAEVTLQELEHLVAILPERAHWLPFIEAADKDPGGLFLCLCERLGVPCSRDELNQIIGDAAVLITQLKWEYNRARPYQIARKHGRLDFSALPSVSAHTPAYPAGHTIGALLIADRLSKRAPQHREAFHKLAQQISYSRVVAGYHWPSDLVFGKAIVEHALRQSAKKRLLCCVLLLGAGAYFLKAVMA